MSNFQCLFIAALGLIIRCFFIEAKMSFAAPSLGSVGKYLLYSMPATSGCNLLNSIGHLAVLKMD